MKQFGEVRFLGACLVFATAFLAPIGSAQAYVGPGLGLGALSVVLGLISSVLLAIFAIVWYPVKRVLKKFNKRKLTAKDKDQQTAE